MGVAQKISGLGSQPDSLCLSGKLASRNSGRPKHRARADCDGGFFLCLGSATATTATTNIRLLPASSLTPERFTKRVRDP